LQLDAFAASDGYGIVASDGYATDANDAVTKAPEDAAFLDYTKSR